MKKEDAKIPSDEQLKKAFSVFPHVKEEQIPHMFKNIAKEADWDGTAYLKWKWEALNAMVCRDRDKANHTAYVAMALFAVWALVLIVEPRFGIIKDFLELPVLLILFAFVYVALYRLSKKDDLARHLTILSYLNSEDGVEWRKYLRDNFGYEVKPLDEDKSH